MQEHIHRAQSPGLRVEFLAVDGNLAAGHLFIGFQQQASAAAGGVVDTVILFGLHQGSHQFGYLAGSEELTALFAGIRREHGDHILIGVADDVSGAQLAPFIVAKAIIPDMIEQGGGKIINICSMMSELGRETVSAYAAAKGGLKMLTKNIASEYGQYNIQCNGIGPGYIATPQTAPLREIQPDGSRHPFDQFIVAKTPAARWGNAEDLGGPAVFLASEASDFVNGLILYVDGGILAYIGKQPG